MKKKIILTAAALLLLFAGISVYAATSFDMTFLSGTTDTVADLPDAETLTGGGVYTVPSQIPQREGYEFIGWKLDYDATTYRVTYVINPDPRWAVPEDSVVPSDPKLYAPNDYVVVADQLTTAADYAFTENGDKVMGTWEFIPWDKADFEITADTVVTGGWRFDADDPDHPTASYHYTVHYYLYGTDTKVHDDNTFYIHELGPVTVDALPISELNKKYTRKKDGVYLYRIKENYESITTTLINDGCEIIVYYEKVE